MRKSLILFTIFVLVLALAVALPGLAMARAGPTSNDLTLAAFEGTIMACPQGSVADAAAITQNRSDIASETTPSVLIDRNTKTLNTTWTTLFATTTSLWPRGDPNIETIGTLGTLKYPLYGLTTLAIATGPTITNVRSVLRV